MAHRFSKEDDDDALLMALQSMEPCGNCGKQGATIPCMSGCGEVFYCSRECNMHHASAHRLRCRNLRCSKFNDSESESGSDDDEEFTDDSEEEETDSEEEEEEEEVKPAKKAPLKKKNSSRRGKMKGKGGKSSRDLTADGAVDPSMMTSRKISVDSEAERRIEEKILRRLKKQEESRIATAIEQRMREEKANWRDEEMNRIIMEMRERFANEMSSSQFVAMMAKKHGMSTDESAAAMQAVQQNMAPPEASSMVSSSLKHSHSSIDDAVAATAAGGAPASAGADGKAQTWNNTCPAFAALRVVVWKHSFLPRMQFEKDPETGIYNSITQLDADESFSHIAIGDMLISINGRPVDSSVVSKDDLDDIFAACPSPLILKFTARDRDNGKVHDYTVTWSNGPLGVTLKDDCSSEKVPIVNRLTKKAGSVAVKQNIAIGDILVAINNIDTIQLGCSLSMSILKKVQLPAKLRFRGVGGPLPSPAPAGVAGVLDIDQIDEVSSNASLSRPSTYNIEWGEGPLGLTIIPGFNDNDLPVIKKVTGTGTSNGIEQAQVGDVLVSMNDIQTSSKPFEEVVSYLKSAKKPVMLTFRAALPDGCEASPRVQKPVVIAPPMPSPTEGNGKSTRSVESTASSNSNLSRSASDGSAVTTTSTRPESMETYQVIWGTGPLGLTIDAIPNHLGAYIKRIAAQGAASKLPQDCVGDELVLINDMEVARLHFQDIVNLLKSVPRPVTLVFKRKDKNASAMSRLRLTDTPVRSGRAGATKDDPQFYNVVWQEGTTLGLSLRGADSTCEYPFITRVTGSGSAAHLPDSVIGDCLVSVEGRSVHIRDRSFEEVMGMLKAMPKPISLKFQARSKTLAQQRPMSTANLQNPHESFTIRQSAAPMGMNGSGGSGPNPHYGNPPAGGPGPNPHYGNPPAGGPGPNPHYGNPPAGGYGNAPYPPHRGGSSAPPPAAPIAMAPGPNSLPSQSPMMGMHSQHSSPHPYQQQHQQPPYPHQQLPFSHQQPAPQLARQGSSLNRNLEQGNTAANEEKFSSIQAPFLAQTKLSAGRRQKMLKGLKK